MRNLKRLSLTAILLSSLCLSVVSQTPSPRITPEPPVGKGTVVLKAARLIDGTGAAAINDAVVVVTDNEITGSWTSGLGENSRKRTE